MAQFDVHRLKDGRTLVLNCQSDLLDQLNTRFVVPLIDRNDAPAAAKRLNPVFEVVGRDHVMLTQFAAAIQRRELGPVVLSLKHRSFEVTDALDVLISGV
jgi:toxin CcdB